MEVQWNGELGETFINETIGSQTFHMAFQEEQYSMDTVYINVYMTLYNKRTQIEANENAVRSTGLNPMQTIKTAIQAFNMLEADAILTHCPSNNVVIYCTWLDNRRRDAYYHFLSRKGYRYGFTPDEHKKCIMKKYKRGDNNMKLWIDDVRPAPSGYVWYQTVDEAIAAIKMYLRYDIDIEIIDLDHDAGDFYKYGGDYIEILNYLEEYLLDIPIRIHSMNVVGVENMRRIIQKNGWREIR